MKIENIFPLILKDGLRKAKFKNSHLKLVSSVDEGNRGAIFAYRSKAKMIQARGLVLTSLEAVLENEGNFTHWTPNVYCYGSYSDEKRQITRGHSEENLRQINTFYIDAIFSFAEGDYLFDDHNCLLVFESRGLANQYIRATFRKPLPIQRTKKIIQFTQDYQAPFKIQKVC